MAIEIKELYIRVSVNTLPGAPPPGGQTAPSEGNATGDEKEALVTACVEQVMQLLRDKLER